MGLNDMLKPQNKWDKKKLSDGIHLISGQHILGEKVNNSGVGMPYLTGPADFPNGTVLRTKYTEHPHSICEKGDILITVKGSGTGKIVVADDKYCISRQLMAIRADHRWSQDFIYHLLNFHGEHFSDASVGLIPGISRDDILNREIEIPATKSEQTAIATALSDADMLIVSLQKLITKKRLIKQGVMQRVLQPKEGWKKTRLGDHVKITSGESPSKFTFVSTGVPFFKVEQLNNSVKYQSHSEYFINTSSPISAGSIIFPKRGASILLNKVRVLAQDSYMDTNLMTLTVTSNLLNNEFLYYMLTYIELWRIADTTSIPQVNNKHINPIELAIPTRTEQEQIATTLSNCDSEIMQLEHKLEKVKRVKQGMMQTLLTGKIRLI